MTEIYLPLKHTHLMFMAISVVFFITRGGSRLLGKTWQTQKWAKISPHVIDTILFVTGILLMFATQQFPIEQSWLTVKLVLLVGYIVFGIKAMKVDSVMQQRTFFAAAILCVLLMITVAKSHHPLGLFSVLL